MIETSCAEKRERGTKMKSIKRLAAAVLAFVMLFTAAVGKLPEMSEDEMLKLLATDGMLVKRPLLVGNDFVLVGFKEAEWAERLKTQ